MGWDDGIDDVVDGPILQLQLLQLYVICYDMVKATLKRHFNTKYTKQ